MSHAAPETLCPSCGAPINCATSAYGEAVPTPGDLSVCVYCTTVLVFCADLDVRLATEVEIDDLPSEVRAQIATVRQAVALSAFRPRNVKAKA